MSIAAKFKNSSRALTDVRTIAVCAMMLAIRIVLGIFANFTLAFMPFVKIGLSFIPTAIVAYLYGPVCAAIVSGAGDVLSIIFANPTAFSLNPGITLCYILEGILYGVVLYGSELRFRDILLAEGVVMLLCRLPLNTLVLCFLMNIPYPQLLLYRAAVLIPFSIVECLVIWAGRKLLFRVKRQIVRQ
ncbi:MAG: folate family ECF transporter S component [Ruminococcus sp.]|nr:folate family ECF transporter S component [Ruminococcus sp.]